jgi:hypothetical protein
VPDNGVPRLAFPLPGVRGFRRADALCGYQLWYMMMIINDCHGDRRPHLPKSASPDIRMFRRPPVGCALRLSFAAHDGYHP